MAFPADIAVVLIGRNEALRLAETLEAAKRTGAAVFYVDSASSDDSPGIARKAGVPVLSLSEDRPLSAARARNEGLAFVRKAVAGLHYLQLIDADCALDPDWLSRGREYLESHPKTGTVCGYRREKRPKDSLYNRLCDLEWDRSLGEIAACGGDALVRVRAFDETGGFNPSLIAGEEPDFYCRMRGKGWTVVRLDALMTWHDAHLLRFGQWWTRAVRAGYAYADGSWHHPPESRGAYRRKSLRIWAWGAVLPLAFLGACAARLPALILCLTALYALHFLKITWGRRRGNRDPWLDSLLYAASCLVGHFAHWQGQCRYYLRRRRPPRLIEYKSAGE